MGLLGKTLRQAEFTLYSSIICVMTVGNRSASTLHTTLCLSLIVSCSISKRLFKKKNCYLFFLIYFWPPFIYLLYCPQIFEYILNNDNNFIFFVDIHQSYLLKNYFRDGCLSSLYWNMLNFKYVFVDCTCLSMLSAPKYWSYISIIGAISEWSNDFIIFSLTLFKFKSVYNTISKYEVRL